MLIEAARLAERQQIRNIDWRYLRAEQLPADLPSAQVVTFAQSFHWMDRHRVAASARALLGPDGSVVHVHATTHPGIDCDHDLPYPKPAREEIALLVRSDPGKQRRAGQGVLIGGTA